MAIKKPRPRRAPGLAMCNRSAWLSGLLDRSVRKFRNRPGRRRDPCRRAPATTACRQPSALQLGTAQTGANVSRANKLNGASAILSRVGNGALTGALTGAPTAVPNGTVYRPLYRPVQRPVYRPAQPPSRCTDQCSDRFAERCTIWRRTGAAGLTLATSCRDLGARAKNKT